MKETSKMSLTELMEYTSKIPISEGGLNLMIKGLVREIEKLSKRIDDLQKER